MHEGNPVLNIQIGGSGASMARLYIYLLNVPSFSSRYFNKIKRTSRLGEITRLMARNSLIPSAFMLEKNLEMCIFYICLSGNHNTCEKC